jgi:bifunctional non-homologous end joining protein LigD
VSPDRVETRIDDRQVTLTNLEKPMYPDAGFTKRDVLDYYARIAPVMLPHLARRPVTLRRFPHGTSAAPFFEKRVPTYAPDWITTTTVPLSASDAHPDHLTALVVADTATLIWGANLAALEFHVPLWRVPEAGSPPGPPDYLVFDLDPGPGTTVVECCRVAGWIADALADEKLGLPGPKTSGSKGLQLYVPTRTGTTWDATRASALEIATRIARNHPDLVTTNMRKRLRAGRVLIDWSQNHPAKTTVAAYSLRGGDVPTVSTPVSWDEVAACARLGEPALLRFTAPDVLGRVAQLGDLMPAPG